MLFQIRCIDWDAIPVSEQIERARQQSKPIVPQEIPTMPTRSTRRRP